jgi:hypothetical protein
VPVDGAIIQLITFLALFVVVAIVVLVAAADLPPDSYDTGIYARDRENWWPEIAEPNF